MNRREMYLTAAELVDSGTCEYACEAIGEALGIGEFVDADDYPELALFKPSRLSTCGGFWHCHHEKADRVVAMCFMAAMASRS